MHRAEAVLPETKAAPIAELPVAAAPALRPFGALRFVLALLVLAHHFGIDLSPPWLKALVVPVAPGDIAVVVFFVLSGFIILDAASHFYVARPWPFLTNRLLRIVPPFVAALVVSIAVHAALVWLGVARAIDGEALGADILGARSLVANALSVIPFMGWSGREGGYVYVWPVWSLRVEMVFYLTMFASILAASLAARWAGYDRALGWTMGALAAGGLALAAMVIARGTASSLQFVPYFVFGCAAYLAWRGSRIAALFGGVALLLMVFHNWGYNPAIFAVYARSHAAQLALLGALLLSFAWLACWSRRSPKGGDRVLGDLAYPLFLNHLTVGVAMKSFWPEGGLSVILLATVLSIGLAVAMQAAVEPAIKAWRDRWRGTAI